MMATEAQKKSNKKVLLVIALIAMLGGGLFSYNIKKRGDAEHVPLQERVDASIYLQPREISEAVLIDFDEQPFTRDQLTGQWTFMFFGFTHCPDICPMTLAVADKLMQQLPQEPVPSQFILVSVDPERDTPARLREYVSYFSPEFLGITGTKENLDAWTDSMGALYFEIPTEDEAGYTIDHSGSIFLVNPEGKVHGRFNMPHDPDHIAQDFMVIRQAYRPS